MRVEIHPDLELSGTTVVDSRLTVRLFLTRDAAWLFNQIRREPEVERLVSVVVRHQRLSRQDARRAIYTFLGIMDEYGGIRVKAGCTAGLTSWLGMQRMWRIRYPATVSGFIQSMARAYGLYILLSMAAAFVFKAVLGQGFTLFWMVTPAALLATCVVHEAGHACCAYVQGTPFVLLARRGAAAIMHTAQPGTQAFWIAFCGPATAMLLCTIAALFLHEPMERIVWAAAGLIHACSMLPFLEDGKTIWRSL